MGKKSKGQPAPQYQQKEPALKQVDAKDRFPVKWKLALLLGIIAFALYANTLKNGFAVDDASVITENKIVTKGASAIPEIFATPYRKGVNMASDLYRPLSLAMFAAEYSLFGPDPAPGHFVNILLFSFCVILLFLFLNDLFEQRKTTMAFIAALLFAMHPIHTEVVANIKSRDELLCFFFVFLSLLAFAKYTQKGKPLQLLGGGACYFLAILSKETAFTFLAVIPLVFFFYRAENRKRSIYIITGVVGVAVACLAIRFAILHIQPGDPVQVPFLDNALAKQGLTTESRLATAVLILGYYMKLLFVPYPLIWDYSYNIIPYTHFSDIWVLLSLAVYVVLSVTGVKLLLRNNKDPFAFAILFFLLTIALFSNIPFLIGSAMGERFLFFPSVGFCLAAAASMDKWLLRTNDTNLLKNKLALGIIIPLSVVYAILTVDRNAEWIDNYTLYKSDVIKAPNGAKVNYFVGYELATTLVKQEKDPAKVKQYYTQSIDYFNKSLAIYPDYDKAEANLAFVYFCLGAYDSSELHGRRAVQLNPDNSFALSNLAAVYNFRKDYPRAIELYKRAIRISPADVSSYAYAGLSYGSMGKYDSAIYYCNQAIAVDPSFNASYEILATTYKLTGNSDSARKYDAIVQKNNSRK